MKTKEIIQTAIILIIAVFLINSLVPFFTGSEKPMIVLSGSMVPLFLPGDVVISKTVSPSELNVGDVITFQAPNSKPGTFVTHRIISIEKGEKRFFQTKGDANNAQDDFKVPASNVIGKLVFVIPFFGYLPDMLKHNGNISILVIILPAGLLVIDEIRNLILYSNPIRARKAEREQKKAARKTYFILKGMRLTALILISALIFSGIVAYNLGENGSSVLRSENRIDNSGFLPMVYVMTPDNSDQTLNIQPWYGVIFKTNNSLITSQNIHFSQNYSMITAPENTPVQISSVPYILPVFWIIALADINPYLPAVAEIVMYTFVVTLILLPIWYKKSFRGRHKKRIRFHRLIAQWKRTLHL